MSRIRAKHDDETQALLFERPVCPWKPEAPPQLYEGETIGFDFEYKPGSNPTKDQPFSLGIYSKERKRGWYLPWAHEGGGNLDHEQVSRFIDNELRGRHLVGLNIKAEVHQLRNLGKDVDRLGFHPHDVGYTAALLDENRYSGFSLKSLVQEYLPGSGEEKVELDIHPSKFYLAHAGEIANRCISDARQALMIYDATRPLLAAEDLMRVSDLEDRLVLGVVEMERNGMILDRAKAEKWSWELDNVIDTVFMQTYRETGLGVNPDSRPEMDRLFAHLGLKKPTSYDEEAREYTENYSEEALETVAHPIVQRVLCLRKIRSMKSKFVDKLLAAADSENIVHFALHQLRSDSTGKDRGTVTGRFSCGGGKYNVNMQQNPKAEDQLEELAEMAELLKMPELAQYCTRELFIAPLGRVLGASDASQIEFRLFAHYSNSPKLIKAYNDDPMIDFHLLVTKMMNPHVTDMKELKALRKHMKHNNFGVLYGMGREKLARRLKLACTCGINWGERDERNRLVNKFWDNAYHAGNCPARKANDIMDEYHHKFPEAKAIVDQARSVAEEKGFVRTLLGRRRRYPTKQRTYSAFNAADQGSAADIFKLKFDMLYNERKDLDMTLRAPVHDEFVYDTSPDTQVQNRIQERLDDQIIPLRVPLLWESDFGPNWRVANGQ